MERTLPFNVVEYTHFDRTGTLPPGALYYFAACVWKEQAFHPWDGSVGQFIGELMFRNLTWLDEHNFLQNQFIPLRIYKLLKRLNVETKNLPSCGLRLVYKVNNSPTAGLALPEPENNQPLP